MLELTSTLGITALEHDITLDELYHAQEAFLTSSLVEIMPLTEVMGKPIGSGQPGPLTRRIMAAYRKIVNEGE